MIVEDEQQGKHRAGYGEKSLQTLSVKLKARFEKGFSVDNLTGMRHIYLIYSLSAVSENSKSATSCGNRRQIKNPQRRCGNLNPALSEFRVFP